MRVREVRLDVLELPLRSAMTTAQGEWSTARLALLRLATEHDLEGLGEVPVGPSAGWVDLAPADAASTGSEAGLAGRLLAALAGIDLEDEEALRAWLARAAPDVPRMPGLRSAVASAVIDLCAQAAGRSVAEQLGRAACGRAPLRLLAEVPAREVTVNGLLGIGEPEVVAAEARGLVAEGFLCLKLKAGAEATGAVARRVAAVREAVGPLVGLRLDLNGTLDELSAGHLLEELGPFALEYVEQPVPVEAGPQALARLRRKGSVPIAADEAVDGVAAMQELAGVGAVDAVVVKPARVGGLAEAARIVELALAAETRVTIATMFESGIGVAAALHLAAVVPGGGAHGLSTASLLADDLVGGVMSPRHGRLRVPSRPGLGVVPDRDAIDRARLDRQVAHA